MKVERIDIFVGESLFISATGPVLLSLRSLFRSSCFGLTLLGIVEFIGLTNFMPDFVPEGVIIEEPPIGVSKNGRDSPLNLFIRISLRTSVSGLR